MSDQHRTTISVFALRHVGCVSAAYPTSQPNRVIGVDVNARKVDSFRQGRIRQQWPRVGDLLTDYVDAELNHGEVLIAGSRKPEGVGAIARAGSEKFVVDLVRSMITEQLRRESNYCGIGW